MLNLERALSLQADYMDARLITSEVLSLTAKDGVIEKIEAGTSQGMGIRALIKGNWGFAATNNTSDVINAAKQAVKLASAASTKTGKEKIVLADTPIARDEIAKRTNMPSLEEAKELVLECESLAKIPRIKSTSSFVVNARIEKTFTSSEGSEVKQSFFRTFLGATSTAKEKGKIQEAFERSSGFTWSHDASIAEKASEAAVRLLKAKGTPTGSMPVIMDPSLVGVFVHEALGHMAEADHALEGQTILLDKIGENIASPLVTIMDDGTAEAYGKIFYDDEGVKASKTTLVENGVFKGFMHNRRTASVFGVQPTGNSRADSYSSVPIVRMTNTYVKKGGHSFNELLEEMRNGVYLIGSRGGQTNPARGIFQFSCKEGYLVENGELKHGLRDAGISGHTLDILRSVIALGRDFKLNDPGSCGKKGQLVPVDGGGPHLLTRAIIGGA